MQQKKEKILLNIPSADAREMDRLVSSGEYSTKSEVVRTALRLLLYGKEAPPEKRTREEEERWRNFEALCEAVQAKVKEKGYTRKDIDRFVKEVKEETREEVRRMLEDAKRKERARK